jgi:hypothetical protein
MSSDLTFITNEPGKSLRDRFGVLLGDDTRLPEPEMKWANQTITVHMKL